MTKNQSNFIKLIAIISMTIDHIGFILFPEHNFLRIIGRIAFPLFAFQIGIGYLYTRNFSNYIMRIFSYGFLIQIAFILANLFLNLQADALYLNIFFTLGLGLMAIYFYDQKQYIYLAITFLLPQILHSVGISIDYNWYGLAFILILFIGRNYLLYTIPIVALLSVIFSKFFLHEYTQMYCLLSFLFMLKPLKLNMNIPSTFFYLYYPLHLAILHGLSIIL
ncbi:MAG: hypothetical protein K0R71_2366 [Bacillales bacterium]|jgi:hypothetical protein|nr:hypothetical protein [Bacillales bacterium]